MNRYAARELVTNSRELSRCARLLYLKLDEHARDKGFCYLKHVTLMDCLKCSKRSLQNWFAELVKAGFCTIERSTTGGANRYHLIHEISTTVRNESQPVARGGAKYCAGEGVVSLLLNTSLELTPLPPFGENENQNPVCQQCFGKGEVLERVTVRNQSQQQWRPCACQVQRRSA